MVARLAMGASFGREGGKRVITSEEVYQARYDARLTQREAAMLIGVSCRTWESWECGARNMPDCKMILFRLLTAKVMEVAK